MSKSSSSSEKNRESIKQLRRWNKKSQRNNNIRNRSQKKYKWANKNYKLAHRSNKDKKYRNKNYTKKVYNLQKMMLIYYDKLMNLEYDLLKN